MTSRQAFEDQIRKQFPKADDELLTGRRVIDGRYASMVTEHAWLAWQAATNAALERAAQKVEPHRSTEAIEVIGGEDGLLMLRELAAEIRALKDKT